jgi:hypothetical protein
MSGALTATDTGSKEYVAGGVSYVVVSAQVMRFVKTARTKCGDANPIELLKVAAGQPGANEEVLKGLFIYGRFELNIHPKDLGELMRSKGVNSSSSQHFFKAICGKASLYWQKVGPSDPRRTR